jgi:hypothetical protein
MFIELAEFLRCPADHEEQSYCVVVPDRMLDRVVHTGSIGCPVCKREYAIVNGAVMFDDVSVEPEAPPTDLPAPEAVQAVLGLAGPGGYVVLVGSAALLAEPLAALLPETHQVVVNPPTSTRPSTSSALFSQSRLPLRDSMARGVVVGVDFTTTHWLSEAARVLLKGLRLVVLSEDVMVDGVEQLAVGNGMWVGRKGQ